MAVAKCNKNMSNFIFYFLIKKDTTCVNSHYIIIYYLFPFNAYGVSFRVRTMETVSPSINRIHPTRKFRSKIGSPVLKYKIKRDKYKELYNYTTRKLFL